MAFSCCSWSPFQKPGFLQKSKLKENCLSMREGNFCGTCTTPMAILKENHNQTWKKFYQLCYVSRRKKRLSPFKIYDTRKRVNEKVLISFRSKIQNPSFRFGLWALILLKQLLLFIKLCFFGFLFIAFLKQTTCPFSSSAFQGKRFYFWWEELRY